MMPVAPLCLPPRDITRPKIPPPPGACDTHAHVFGPADRFAYADEARQFRHAGGPFALPDRLRGIGVADVVFGGDWPHPRVEGEMPEAGHLFELFQQWTPDLAIQKKILVANPAKLYGFPN